MNINIEIFGKLIRSWEFSDSSSKRIFRIFVKDIGGTSSTEATRYIYSVLETTSYPHEDTEMINYYKEYFSKSSAWAYITNSKPILTNIGYKLTDSKSTSYYKKLFVFTNN